MADYEAIRWYNEWAYELRNRIRTDNPVSLKRIGILRKDYSEEIFFEAERLYPRIPDTVPAQRVIHSHATHTVLVGDREMSNEQAKEYLVEETQVEKESWWIYAVVLVAISLVVLFFHFYKNGFGTNAMGNQQSIGVPR